MHKADLKANNGDTAVHSVAWKGHDEVVRLLLEHKVDVNPVEDQSRL